MGIGIKNFLVLLAMLPGWTAWSQVVVSRSNGINHFEVSGRAVTPMMAIVPDTRDAFSDTGVFKICSEVRIDAWKTYTKREFTPPYTIETVMKVCQVREGGGVYFGIPAHMGPIFNIGLYRQGGSRLRVEGAYGKASWKVGEWVPVRLRVERHKLTLTAGDDRLEVPLKHEAIAGSVCIATWCAEGAWQTIRITEDHRKDSFVESWNGREPSQWQWSNGRQLLQHVSQCGVRLFQIPLDASARFTKDGDYDFSHFDARCKSLLRLVPDGLLVARLLIDTRQTKGILPLDAHGKPRGRYAYSFSNPEELRLQKEFLKTFLKHLDEQSYGNSLCGILLMSGNGGEWVYHFTPSDFADYSPEHCRAFQDYARRKYGTIEALNRAWGSAAKTFSDLVLPSPLDRKAGPGKALLLDPVTDLRIMDFMDFHSHTIANKINILTKTVKEHSSIPRLVGVYYGYTAGATASVFNKGHNALDEVLRGPVDFIACPYQYRNRRAGHPILMQLPFLSALHHGKAVFLEDDTRTSFYEYLRDYLRENSLEDSRGTLRRNFLQSLSWNLGIWYLDFCCNWFAREELKPDMMAFGEAMKGRLAGRFQSKQPEIVALVSEKAFNRMRHDQAAAFEPVFRQLSDVLGACGAPFDVALLSDLKTLPAYKFYFVLNYPAAPPEEKAVVEALRKKLGNRVFTPRNFACVPLPEVLKKLDEVQVFRYTDKPAAVYRGETYLGVHTLKGSGKLTVTFPAGVQEVREYFSDKHQVLKDGRLTLDAPAGRTFMWTWK